MSCMSLAIEQLNLHLCGVWFLCPIKGWIQYANMWKCIWVLHVCTGSRLPLMQWWGLPVLFHAGLQWWGLPVLFHAGLLVTHWVLSDYSVPACIAGVQSVHLFMDNNIIIIVPSEYNNYYYNPWSSVVINGTKIASSSVLSIGGNCK